MSTRPPAIAIIIFLLLVACDEPKDGKPCLHDGAAVCGGSARMLLCTGGTWATIACGGAKGCSASPRFIDCDESRAADGDPCGRDAQGNAACSHDGKQSLECQDGRWRPHEACPGPSGCALSGDQRWVDCDGARLLP